MDGPEVAAILVNSELPPPSNKTLFAVRHYWNVCAWLLAVFSAESEIGALRTDFS